MAYPAIRLQTRLAWFLAVWVLAAPLAYGCEFASNTPDPKLNKDTLSMDAHRKRRTRLRFEALEPRLPLSANLPPLVDAGPDLTLPMSETAALDGTVSDDGLPASGSGLSTAWVKVRGPGEVTFSDALDVDTSAAFTEPGTYELRLEANDGELTSVDYLTIDVLAASQAPLVDAGADQTVLLGADVLLDGTITGSGANDVMTTWISVSGPSLVMFADPSAEDTSAHFMMPVPGTYVLQLQADNGELTGSDQVTITVEAPNTAPVVDAGNDQSILVSDVLTLGGSATDDGLPTAPGQVTTSWSVISGPGEVVFDDPSTANATATFTDPGTYVLQLEATDGVLTSSDHLTVLVNSLPPVPQSSISQSFNNAVDSFIGARSASKNYGSATTLEVDNGPHYAALLKWDLRDIPSGAVVDSVTLRLNVVNPTRDAYEIYELKKAWVENAVTWASASDQSSWEVAGAQGPNDRGRDVLGALTAPTTGPATIELHDAALEMVQSWIENPEQNYGLIIQDYANAADGVDFSSSETATAANRPTLAVTYHMDETPATNLPPVVDAGSDQTTVATNTITLRASVSDDGLPSIPGTVTTTWTQVSGPGEVTFGDASAIETTARFSAPGTYVLRLQANDGQLTMSDDVTVTVTSLPGPQHDLHLEAEAGTLSAPLATHSHADASGQQYVSTDSADQGSISLTLDIAEAGDYVIWARVMAPSGSHDSFFVSVDGGPEDVFDAAEGKWSDQWQWTVVNGRGGTGQPLTLNPRVLNLSGGTHTVTFRAREPGTGLDMIIVTKDLAFAPNQAPVVDAGPSRSVQFPNAISLQGTVSDDKSAELATSWSKVSGPGAVTFGDASAINTTATFAETGAYVLRLEASDGELSASDVVTVTVTDAQTEVTGFFVSPNGSSTGNGSAENPWDIKTLLSHPSRVQPGDTIWLRGGTYQGHFQSHLTGTADKPIIVRAYPGEHVRIDTYDPRSNDDSRFSIRGDYTHYWGLEVMSSDPSSRVTSESGSHPNSVQRGGIYNYGDHNKFINLVVHDLNNGFGFWADGAGGEIYGTIIYNNGWIGSDRQHGHGIYTQNQFGQKRIADNIIFNQFGYGIQAYGSSTHLNGYLFEGNVLFNAGAGAGEGYKRGSELLMGGGTPASDITITENLTYHNNLNGTVDIGYAYGVNNKDLTLTDNYFATEARFWKRWDQLDASGNTVVGDISGNAPSTGLTAASPSGVKVFVRPNEYEQGRANIVVYNWDKQASVDIDLSTVLSIGSQFEIHHVHDLYGAPVVSGVYEGQQVKLAMAASEAPRPIGGRDLNDPVTLGSEFGTFIVRTISP